MILQVFVFSFCLQVVTTPRSPSTAFLSFFLSLSLSPSPLEQSKNTHSLRLPPLPSPLFRSIFSFFSSVSSHRVRRRRSAAAATTTTAATTATTTTTTTIAAATVSSKRRRGLGRRLFLLLLLLGLRALPARPRARDEHVRRVLGALARRRPGLAVGARVAARAAVGAPRGPQLLQRLLQEQAAAVEGPAGEARGRRGGGELLVGADDLGVEVVAAVEPQELNRGFGWRWRWRWSDRKSSGGGSCRRRTNE